MHKLNPRLLSWATDLEESAQLQAERTSRLPFIAGHVALMPDAHYGYGSTVGSVIPTQGAVIPSAVGVDIGCGMIAVETTLSAADLPDDLGRLHGLIRDAVPAGVGKTHTPSARHTAALMRHYPSTPVGMSSDLASKALGQFGTLGGGNHFVEVCIDERDVVWVVLHSGSRGVGKSLADVHMKNAKAVMAKYFIELEDPELAYLVDGTDEFVAYITDMHWAQAYALGNREAMMDAVLDCLALTQGIVPGDGQMIEADRINCHHNYCEREHHHGRNVWLTRKGAIRAREGDRGVIPGSMGTSSFIVRGLGSAASYESCSHGAGRRMGRKAAERILDVAGLVAAMAGKTWDDRDAQALIDEDPRAYKDVHAVMAAQSDLVAIEHTLNQVLNYKGTR